VNSLPVFYVELVEVKFALIGRFLRNGFGKFIPIAVTLELEETNFLQKGFRHAM
jgi:hypothetical protein